MAWKSSTSHWNRLNLNWTRRGVSQTEQAHWAAKTEQFQVRVFLARIDHNNIKVHFECTWNSASLKTRFGILDEFTNPSNSKDVKTVHGDVVFALPFPPFTSRGLLPMTSSQFFRPHQAPKRVERLLRPNHTWRITPVAKGKIPVSILWMGRTYFFLGNGRNTPDVFLALGVVLPFRVWCENGSYGEHDV